MCGIAGIIYRQQEFSGFAREAVRKMNAHMRARGPDAEGLWEGDGAVLGHRRLAILDLDARSNQPLVSGLGRHVIVFNGEIYNFGELRQELLASGCELRTTSDTEVLLELFVRFGESMLPKLRGMFAFAIWDTQTRELFMARDPYGIKPLYYANTENGFVFASQVKTLISSGAVPVESEPAGMAGFFLWGNVPEPWTMYRDVFALRAGHSIWVRAGVPAVPRNWQDIGENWQSAARSASVAELQEIVREAVTDSVRAHLIADVPVSVFLSGGIDSAAVAALATQLGGKVEGITIGFEEYAGLPDDEAPVAAAIAKHYGISHHLRRVSRKEFEQDVPLILKAMDQPSVDGVNTWFASKAAAERGYKVVLSGIGGDELFCGYPSFHLIPRAAIWGKLMTGLPGVSGACAYLAKRRSNPKLAGVPTYLNSVEGAYFLKRSLFLPHELAGIMGVENAREGLARLGGSPPGMLPSSARNGLSFVGLLESSSYLRNQLLRDSDWASMAHSLELRAPLVDYKLLAQLGSYVPSFKGGQGKRMLAASPQRPLPPEIVNRPKTGFTIPMTQWLSESVEQNLLIGAPETANAKTSWARRWAIAVAKNSMSNL